MQNDHLHPITTILLAMSLTSAKAVYVDREATIVRIDIQAISIQLRLYAEANGVLPTTEQGLQALVTQPQSEPRPPRWYQLCKELPQDPWNNNYIYKCPGVKNPKGYDLYSAGPDRQRDTADDHWGG